MRPGVCERASAGVIQFSKITFGRVKPPATAGGSDPVNERFSSTRRAAREREITADRLPDKYQSTRCTRYASFSRFSRYARCTRTTVEAVVSYPEMVLGSKKILYKDNVLYGISACQDEAGSVGRKCTIVNDPARKIG